MDRSAFFRKAIFAAGMFAILPYMLLAQEHSAEEARAGALARGVSVLHVESESLLRVDFPGRKSWGHVEKGAVLEGRLSLPLYAGEHIAAPADSTIRVTVNSVEKIREDLGAWRKTGRAIVRALNPLETSRPNGVPRGIERRGLAAAHGRGAVIGCTRPARQLRSNGPAESQIIAGGRCSTREEQSVQYTADCVSRGSVVCRSG